MNTSSTSPYQLSLWGSNMTDNGTKALPFHDSAKAEYTTISNNQTFVLGDSSTKGRCQPASTYQWGFSFLLLFDFLLLLFIWSIGTYSLWINVRSSVDPLEEPPEIAGGYKAVLELASVMNSQFGKIGEDAIALREQQIQRMVKKDLIGGSMKYRSGPREQGRWFGGDDVQWDLSVISQRNRILGTLAVAAFAGSCTFVLLAF